MARLTRAASINASRRGVLGGVCGSEGQQGDVLARAQELGSLPTCCSRMRRNPVGKVLARESGSGAGSLGLLGGPAWLQGSGGHPSGRRGAWESERGRGRERERVAAWPRRAQELLPRDHDDNLAQIGPPPSSLGLR